MKIYKTSPKNKYNNFHKREPNIKINKLLNPHHQRWQTKKAFTFKSC